MSVRKVDHLRSTELALAAQRQLQDEVEKNLRLSSVTTIETLYELHDLRDFERSSTAELTHRWSHCRLQPDYRNFVRQWIRASHREITGVEFRYALLYQEIRILEKILKQDADLEGFAHNDTDRGCCEYRPSLPDMSVAHVCF